MPRELNKELFSGRATGSDPLSPQKGPRSASQSEVSEYKFRELVLETQRLKRQVKDLESRLDTSNNRMHELSTNTKKGFERLQGMHLRLEKMAKTSLQELASRVSTISGKLTERRVTDDKIQGVIDRHNNVVQQFEARVGQMQKLISEQEMKLLSYKSSLEDLVKRKFR